jgi:hypothetical protein
LHFSRISLPLALAAFFTPPDLARVGHNPAKFAGATIHFVVDGMKTHPFVIAAPRNTPAVSLRERAAATHPLLFSLLNLDRARSRILAHTRAPKHRVL